MKTISIRVEDSKLYVFSKGTKMFCSLDDTYIEAQKIVRAHENRVNKMDDKPTLAGTYMGAYETGSLYTIPEAEYSESTRIFTVDGEHYMISDSDSMNHNLYNSSLIKNAVDEFMGREFPGLSLYQAHPRYSTSVLDYLILNFGTNSVVQDRQSYVRSFYSTHTYSRYLSFLKNPYKYVTQEFYNKNAFKMAQGTLQAKDVDFIIQDEGIFSSSTGKPSKLLKNLGKVFTLKDGDPQLLRLLYELELRQSVSYYNLGSINGIDLADYYNDVSTMKRYLDGNRNHYSDADIEKSLSIIAKKYKIDSVPDLVSNKAYVSNVLNYLQMDAELPELLGNYKLSVDLH